ncbi:DUF1684 domain-containing protein [bacterium]|nr:DUF1684 domain-containing protein [bacterium]
MQKMIPFRILPVVILTMMIPVFACENTYEQELSKWRADRERSLRSENGWLSLVGRYPLKEGVNSIGSGNDNDVIFPDSLEGVGPERLGEIVVDSERKTVTLKLTDGVAMNRAGQSFSGETKLSTAVDKRDWVSLGRMSMHIIERGGRYFLRLADNASPLRLNFPGCKWYPPDETFAVQAKFVRYPETKMLSIVNIIDEVSEQPCPGYAEFRLGGEVVRLDAIQEGDGLFFIFRDATAGDTTYRAARFLDVEKTPEPNATFLLDFNKAYNPPCAFSQCTTCPLPPKRNVLKLRIEAGEMHQEKPN